MTAQNKPKKIGRPRVFRLAMTTSERQQRYRAKVQKQAQELLALINKNNETLL